MTLKDLDAKRAARSEAQNQAHTIVLGGERFTFPAQLPFEVLELMSEGMFRQAFELLLDDPDQADRFFKHRPDNLDLEEIMALYGPPGESSASRPSSASNGGRSRPTSRRATTSTSAKRAGAPALSAADASGS